MSARAPLTKIPRSKKSITLEKELETRLHKIQGRLIEKTDRRWTLSEILNILITGALYQTKKMSKNDWQKIRKSVEDKAVIVDDYAISDFIKKLS